MKKSIIRRLMGLAAVFVFSVMLSQFVAFADGESGWREIDGKWFYYLYDEAFYADGPYVIGGDCYLFETDGSLVKNHAGQYGLVYETENFTQTRWYTIDDNGIVQPGWFITTLDYPDGSRTELRQCIDRLANMVFGWAEIDGKTYYFNPDQLCQSGGILNVDNKLYLFASDGSLDAGNERWFEQDLYNYGYNSWFYVYANGELAAGWKTIEGKTYYFNPWSGEQFCHNGGPYNIDNKLYLFGNDGAVIQNQAGWNEVTYVRNEDLITEGYTIDAEGAVQPGWHVERFLSAEDGSVRYEYWYYIKNEAGEYQYGWQEIDGKKYYFQANQACREGGILWIDGSGYFFGTDGALLENQAGWMETTTIWSDGGSTTYGVNIDSQGLVQLGWYMERYSSGEYLEESWYYLDNNGTRVTGWYDIDGKRYYFQEWDGRQLYREGGFGYADDKIYSFNSDGSLETGNARWIEQSIDGYTSWYYVDADGEVATGWKTIDGKCYYFNPWNGAQCIHGSGVYNVDGVLYLFGNDGALLQNQAGWNEVTYEWSGERIVAGYTINAEGAVQPGWHVERRFSTEDGSALGEDWYCIINEAGEFANGWQEIDGKKYYFQPNQVYRNGGIFETDGTRYFIDSDGALAEGQAGWKELSVTQRDSINDFSWTNTYGVTIDNQGVIQPGWYYEGYTNSDSYSNSYWYCLDANYNRLSGWQKIGDKWYYFQEGTGIQLYREGGFGFVDEDGATYLFDADGAVVQNQAGWHETTTEYETYTYTYGCTIDSAGKCSTGWMIETWDYSKSSGSINTNRYYCDSNGNQVTGWLQISGKTYYFSPMQTGIGGGFFRIDDKTYLFDSDGTLHDTPGWYDEAYVTEDGSLAAGWTVIDGKRYYFDPWSHSQCYRTGGFGAIDGTPYLFDSDGTLVQNRYGWYEVSSVFENYVGTGESYTVLVGYYINSEGIIQPGWHLVRTTNNATGESYDNWYCVNANGYEEYGWKDIDGKRYYFNPSQACRDGGIQFIDDKAYLFGDDGALIRHEQGWYETTKTYDEGLTLVVRYYFLQNDEVALGWQTIDGKTYYFYPEQACYHGGGYAYIATYDEYGEVVEGKVYIFGEDGALVQNQAGWYEFVSERRDDGYVTEGYTIDAEGAVTAGWHKWKYTYYGDNDNWDGNWYYLKENGEREFGWKKIDGKWYYFNPEQVCREGGTYEIEGKMYLFGDDGALIQRQPGWYEYTRQYDDGWVESYRYYFKTAEELATEWYKIDGKWYYFSPWGGSQQCTEGGIYSVDGKLYLFNNDGSLVFGKPGQQSVYVWYNYEYDEYSCSVTSGGVVRDGWVIVYHQWSGYGNVFDDRHYVINGAYVHGWQKIDGKWYYFEPDEWSEGRMVCRYGGVSNIEGKLYYFNKDGSLLQHGVGWLEAPETNWDGSLTSNWYYFINAEELASGWTKIGGDWYHFDYNGLQSCHDGGVMEIDGKHYLFEEGGKLVQYRSGLYKTSKIKDPSGTEYESAWYYLATDGEVLSGWKKIDGKWYYFKNNDYYNYGKMVCMEGGLFRADDGKNYFFTKGGALLTGDAGWKKWTSALWNDLRSYWSYIDNNGVAATGLQTIDGKNYYLDARGIMLENGELYLDEEYYLFGAGGAQVTKPGWNKVTSDFNNRYEWYYINEDGTLKTGWLKDGGKWYYLLPRMACNEDLRIEDGNSMKTYLFDKSGALVQYKAGWNKKIRTIGGVTVTDWYYLNTAGEAEHGYRQIDGKWYYLREEDGLMVSGRLATVDGKTKLFLNDGAEATGQGWYKCTVYNDMEDEYQSFWYYIDADGTLADGWKKIDGKWYYFYYMVLQCPDGGVAWCDNELYFFANGGALGKQGWNKLTRSVDGNTQVFWYYLNAAGVVQTEWQKIDGKWYYLGDEYDHGVMYCDGLYWVDGRYEYFNQSGVCETAMGTGNWRRVGSSLRYVQADGTYFKGWKRIGSNDYFFDANGDLVEHGWVEYNGKKYFFDPMAVRGVNDIYEEYYEGTFVFDSDGALRQEGPVVLTFYEYGTNVEKTCYVDNQGKLYVGWKKLDGKWYYFGYQGYGMNKDCLILDNGRYYRLDKDGVWTGESWRAADDY
jgi:glucan-binding YG repeat protein